MSACALILIAAIAPPPSGPVRAAVGLSIGEESRPPAAIPGPPPAGLAIPDRPTGRTPFRPGPRACGAHPPGAGARHARVAIDPVIGVRRHGGRPATLDRNPVLRC